MTTPADGLSVNQEKKLADALSVSAKAISDESKNYMEVLSKLRAICTHSLVSECEYEPETTYSYASPPSRICEVCGIEEDGWGCGYQILTGDRVRKVSRDRLYGMRKDDPIEIAAQPAKNTEGEK